MLASGCHFIQSWKFKRMTPEEQQRAIRLRTIEAKDSNITDNPVTIEMSEVAAGEIKVARQRMGSIEAQRTLAEKGTNVQESKYQSRKIRK
jgi:hypothetical protein